MDVGNAEMRSHFFAMLLMLLIFAPSLIHDSHYYLIEERLAEMRVSFFFLRKKIDRALYIVHASLRHGKHQTAHTENP